MRRVSPTLATGPCGTCQRIDLEDDFEFSRGRMGGKIFLEVYADYQNNRRSPSVLCFAGPFWHGAHYLIKIGISLAGFAALAVLIWTGRLDAALPFAAIALGFALYGMPSGRRGG